MSHREGLAAIVQELLHAFIRLKVTSMLRRTTHLISAFVLLCIVTLADRVEAAEEILSYDVTVVIGVDGALDVDERIHVNAEGKQIKRGIYRDLPVEFRSEADAVQRAGFTVIGTMRDGEVVPWHSVPLPFVDRIYIGDKNVFIPLGIHEFVLRYRATGQLHHFIDHVEIQWNATGSWTFPILRASVRINLPAGAHILSKTAYTGPIGATGQDWRITSESDISILFETTRTLAPKEGLTVAVGFPKGIVAEPSAVQQ